MRQVGVGVIGCGGMGRGLVSAAQAVGAKVVGGADSAPEVLKQFTEQFACPGYGSAEELLSNGSVEAVFVASPNYMHCEHVVAVARAGRHVFCEKPMALTVADCDRMIAECKQAGVKLMVGQVLRYIADLWHLLELVRAGTLGKPAAAAIERLWGVRNDTWRVEWRKHRELCGGPLYEVNVHELDYMCELLGQPTQAYAVASKFVETPHDYEDVVMATYRFADGGVGTLHGGGCSPLGRYQVAVFCEQGDLFLDRGAGVLRYKTIGGEAREQATSEIKGEPSVQREVREFLEAVTEGKRVTIPGEHGRRAIAMIEAAYRSAASGEPVTID
jgi:predicted dehydrogenase